MEDNFDWSKKNVKWDSYTHIDSVIFLKYGYDADNKKIAVGLDYEYPDDFHYKLSIEEWQKFCLKVLKPGDEIESFRAFIKETIHPVKTKKGLIIDLGKFAFEEKLNEFQIRYLKCAMYSYDYDE